MDDLEMYPRRLLALKKLRNRYTEAEDPPESSVWIVDLCIRIMEGDADFWVNQYLMHESTEE